MTVVRTNTPPLAITDSLPRRTSTQRLIHFQAGVSLGRCAIGGVTTDVDSDDTPGTAESAPLPNPLLLPRVWLSLVTARCSLTPDWGLVTALPNLPFPHLPETRSSTTQPLAAPSRLAEPRNSSPFPHTGLGTSSGATARRSVRSRASGSDCDNAARAKQHTPSSHH